MKERLLADLTSRDVSRIWSATWAVLKTRDPEVLSFLAARKAEIEDATDRIELGGMIQSNRRFLADPSSARDFVAKAKNRELDHLLLLKPGTDRGWPS